MTRRQQIQSRASALANAAGSRSGVVLAAAAAPAEDGTTSAELWLYGVVGGYWFGFNDKSVADQLRGLNVDQITVRLNSPGGDSIQGIAIGNLFRNHKAHVTVVVDGLAASAASIIAIAGDEVVMSPGSQMMIHDPWFFTMGNAAQLREDADFLDKQGANMASVYALRGDGDAETWRAAMTATPDGTWYSAQEAVDAKLADRIGTVVAVSAAPEPPAVDMEAEDDEVAARAAWDLEVLISPAARAAWNVRAEPAPKPPIAPADGNTQPEGAAVVDLNDEQITALREQVGFPADADADTIVAAVKEALAERAEPPKDKAPVVPEGHVVIPAAKLADLEAGAKLATETAAAMRSQERDTFLDANRSKYLPANRDAWATEYDRDPQATIAHFATAPDLIPVAELGHAQGGDAEALAADADYMALFPDEKPTPKAGV